MQFGCIQTNFGWLDRMGSEADCWQAPAVKYHLSSMLEKLKNAVFKVKSNNKKILLTDLLEKCWFKKTKTSTVH